MASVELLHFFHLFQFPDCGPFQFLPFKLLISPNSINGPTEVLPHLHMVGSLYPFSLGCSVFQQGFPVLIGQLANPNCTQVYFRITVKTLSVEGSMVHPRIVTVPLKVGVLQVSP